MRAFLAFALGPPVPFLPEQWHGKSVCVVVGMWTGDPAEGPGRWQPLLDVAPVAGSLLGPMPYPALNGAFDPLLHQGLQGYWKASFLAELNDGAVQRVGPTETALANRNMKFAPVVAGMWEDPADNEANIQWVRDYAAALRQHSEPGAYVNFMDWDDQPMVAGNYGANYGRPSAIKAKYDPQNFFHINQNIPPGQAG